MGEDFSFKLTNDQIMQMFSTSIVSQIKNKDKILTAAVKELITPREYKQSSGYGSYKSTPIQEAMKLGIEQYAHTLAREILDESPEFKEKMKNMMLEAFTKWIESDGADKMADTFKTLIAKELWD